MLLCGPARIILREMLYGEQIVLAPSIGCIIAFDRYLYDLVLFNKYLLDLFFLFFRSKVPNFLGVFVESCCYHSSQLFTTVHSEISQAQIRSTKLFKADELTSGLT